MVFVISKLTTHVKFEDVPKDVHKNDTYDVAPAVKLCHTLVIGCAHGYKSCADTPSRHRDGARPFGRLDAESKLHV